MSEAPRVTSFRQLDEYLKKAGVPRSEQMIRNNIYIAPLSWFHIEPGFNLRPIDPEHAEGFARSYEQGLYVPPVVAELLIVDGQPRLAMREGHHRITGARIAEARGTALPGLVVTEFKGNKADAVAMMIKTSEGKPLTPLQLAEGYKRLSGQHWPEEQIAERMGRSQAHVERHLMLANADESIKLMVKEDKVSATVAMDVIRACRANGSDPLQTLQAMLTEASSKGRQRATAKEAAKALGTFKVTPKQAQRAFSALQVLEEPLRDQLAGDGPVKLNLELPADEAKHLLSLLEKFTAATNAQAQQ
ncbi:hypothetical protein Q1Z72_00830 [Pseudomonas qingdaonensis]|uniref:ParB/RepB/Spo0J family partition protein n=1 Tax=Pseudomonas qingdaonensis TaxID=2056231 RepID=UPI00265D653C|nr:hypothetical protein [Pseudomonas qingdaonensis]WKL67253.1 hypothetical protein Q1Z72_00830 [Pseudomonas qingdaonensis]